jgi:hypothetical protein
MFLVFEKNGQTYEYYIKNTKSEQILNIVNKKYPVSVMPSCGYLTFPICEELARHNKYNKKLIPISSCKKKYCPDQSCVGLQCFFCDNKECKIFTQTLCEKCIYN